MLLPHSDLQLYFDRLENDIDEYPEIIIIYKNIKLNIYIYILHQLDFDSFVSFVVLRLASSYYIISLINIIIIVTVRRLYIATGTYQLSAIIHSYSYS